MSTMPKVSRTVFALASTVFFSACGWGSDGTPRLQDTYPSSCSNDFSCNCSIQDAVLGEVLGEGATGQWAMKVMQSGTFAPAGDPPWDITVTDLVLATFTDFSPDGSGMILTFCDQPSDIDTHGNDILKPETVVPQALKDSVPPLAIPFTDSSASGIPAGTQVVWLWGITGLEDPANDPVPDDPNSPNAWDQDGDGQAGVTIEVLAPVPGVRYMARRAVWDLDEGILSEDGQWITGSLQFQIDEKGLGADPNVLNTVAPITSNETGNVYQMRRVHAQWSCDDMVAQYPTLFDDAP